jgi:hypothetical protein
MRGSPAVLPLATALLLGGCVRHGPLRAVWEDPRTRLELIRDPRRSVATVYGLLVDRLPDRAD